MHVSVSSWDNLAHIGMRHRIGSHGTTRCVEEVLIQTGFEALLAAVESSIALRALVLQAREGSAQAATDRRRVLFPSCRSESTISVLQ